MRAVRVPCVRFVAAIMLESSAESPEWLDEVEQSLEELQEERCACMQQLDLLLAEGSASDAQVSRYVQRIDAINAIMLSLARATTACTASQNIGDIAPPAPPA